MTAPNHKERAHAELGASSSSRWMACPGSIRLSRGIPEVETEYSIEGTAAHELGELALRRDVDPDLWFGLELSGVKIDEDMIDAVRTWVEHCRDRMQQCTLHWIEKKFSLARLNPPGEMFGTSDFVGYVAATKTLYVDDYKHGVGVPVEVKGNGQLRYYALGAAMEIHEEHPELAIEKVVITIVQPRAQHVDGVVRSEEIDYLELLGFASDLLEAARATLDPNAPLHPGSHCRFCPAAGICPAKKEEAQALAQVEFEVLAPDDGPPVPSAIPIEQLADMVTKFPILEAWMASARQHIQNELERGREVPGFKLVEKRATRKWVDENQARRYLEGQGLDPTEILDMKLKSPAAVEAVLNGGKKTKRKDRVQLPDELTKKESSGNTLAPIDDRRPAVLKDPGDDFTALPPGSE